MDISLTALIAAQLMTLAPASPAPLALPALPTPAEVARAQDVVYSDAYFKRLAVHRAASVAILPLFALQVAAGTQLYANGSDAPQWAKVGHRVGATGVAALFVTNVVTGVPNLVAGRRDPNERGRRFFHATMMLTASAGFTATGLLAERAESSPDDRDLHRAVALTSVAIATIGYLSMLDVFRPD
jgi:hypothetical protein